MAEVGGPKGHNVRRNKHRLTDARTASQADEPLPVRHLPSNVELVMNILAFSSRFSRAQIAISACYVLSILVFQPTRTLAQATNYASSGGANSSQLDSHLKTGEFTLARKLADTSKSPATRDAALAKIAVRQREVGAIKAAIETLAEITNDTVRAQIGFGQRQQGGGFGGGQQQGGGLGVGGGAGGQQGGQSQADFDTLIELITTTVDPDTWEEVGGQGTIAGFPGGVYIDAKGVLQQAELRDDATLRPGLTIDAGSFKSGAIAQVDPGSERVFVSLPRLEKALQLRRAAGLPPGAELKALGGLGGVDSLHVFPESGDVVIAGPRAASLTAALQLDDLTVVMRAIHHGAGKFGCSINPRQANLKQTQSFLTESSQRSLKPGERTEWLEKLSSLMGRQDVEVFGIPADTATAQVLVVADYHMKRIGMGLEEGTDEVRDYFECMEDFADNLPPLDILRWWFTSHFDGIAVNDDETVYELMGDAVQVLSENELLDRNGKRVHTGKTHPVNREFAQQFTQHFDDLALRYPIYARLRGIFQLSVVAAIVVEDDLAARVGWQPTMLINDDGYLAPKVAPATDVDSIVGHRVFNRTQIVAGVSGGVSFEPRIVSNTRAGSPGYASEEAHRMAKPDTPRGAKEPWQW